MASECIHDRRYEEQLFTKANGSETMRWCSDCGALLFTTRMRFDGVTPQFSTIYHDDTYRLLYTRDGRRELVREAIKARGWEVPSFWEEPRRG